MTNKDQVNGSQELAGERDESQATRDLSAGVSGKAGSWTGVIRQGKKEVWRCPHLHTNRHETSGYNPISAYTCASHVLDAFLRPDSTKKYEQWLNGAYFARAWQNSHAQLILRLHRWADSQVETLRAAISNTQLA